MTNSAPNQDLGEAEETVSDGAKIVRYRVPAMALVYPGFGDVHIQAVVDRPNGMCHGNPVNGVDHTGFARAKFSFLVLGNKDGSLQKVRVLVVALPQNFRHAKEGGGSGKR